MTFTYDGAEYTIDRVKACVTAQIADVDKSDVDALYDDAIMTAEFLLQAIEKIECLQAAFNDY